MLLLLKNLKFQTQFSSDLTFFTEVAVEKSLLVEKYWPAKTIIFLCFGLISDRPQMPELFVIWTHPDFRSHVSAKQLTCFLLSTSQSKAFDKIWIIPSKMVGFIRCNGSLIDQKCGTVLLFLICLDFQTQFLLYST